MSANPKFLAATAQVDQAAIQPLPKSRKIYIEGSRADLRVPCGRSRRARRRRLSAPSRIRRLSFTTRRVRTPIRR